MGAAGIFERKALYEFVFANKLPLVIDFNRENAPSIFDSEIKKQVSQSCFVFNLTFVQFHSAFSVWPFKLYI